MEPLVCAQGVTIVEVFKEQVICVAALTGLPMATQLSLGNQHHPLVAERNSAPISRGSVGWRRRDGCPPLLGRVQSD
jgi:urease accessory protein UreE